MNRQGPAVQPSDLSRQFLSHLLVRVVSFHWSQCNSLQGTPYIVFSRSSPTRLCACANIFVPHFHVSLNHSCVHSMFLSSYGSCPIKNAFGIHRFGMGHTRVKSSHSVLSSALHKCKVVWSLWVRALEHLLLFLLKISLAKLLSSCSVFMGTNMGCNALFTSVWATEFVSWATISACCSVERDWLHMGKAGVQ